MSAPSTVKYVRLKGTSQDEGLSFSGIQEATLSQIGYSLGKIAQNRIMATSIGSYLLRTGTQGAPTVTQEHGLPRVLPLIQNRQLQMQTIQETLSVILL